MSRSQQSEMLQELLNHSEAELTKIGWQRITKKEDEIIWVEHAPVDCMACVISGELVVHVAGQATAIIAAGQMVGEASVFFPGETRIGDVIATQNTELFVLDTKSLETLEENDPKTFFKLLRMATDAVWERIADKDVEISEISESRLPAPKTVQPGFVLKLWNRFTGTDPGEAPALEPVLYDVPILDEAHEEVVKEIANAMTPHYIADQHALFYEAELGSSLFVIAQGSLNIIRNSDEETAHLLAVLPVGTFVGIGSFLKGSPRSASAVAHNPVWIYEMKHENEAKLSLEARIEFHRTLLSTLRDQLMMADRLLDQTEASSSEFAALQQATGLLHGAPQPS